MGDMMRKHFNSVKKKIFFSDLLVISPLIILFSVLMMFVLRDSNLRVNNSRMDVLEERCGKIAKSNDEITRIINALSINQTLTVLCHRNQKQSSMIIS